MSHTTFESCEAHGFRQEDLYFPISVYVKMVNSVQGKVCSQGNNLNYFSREPLDDTVYQTKRKCTWIFRQEEVFVFKSI